MKNLERIRKTPKKRGKKQEKKTRNGKERKVFKKRRGEIL